MKKSIVWCVVLMIFMPINQLLAWEGMPMPKLHVEGRYLKDSTGHIVNLHGFAQTYSPWFNEQNKQWNNYDVQACLTYNQQIIDDILTAGWEMNFVRLHMDPYWSNTPGCTGRYEGEECFSETRFVKYLDEVFVPMAEYAVTKGLYVVMRPPGVCPENIEIGGVYQEYLLKVWDIVAQHPKLKNNPNIMFELANEPIHILGPDGTYGSGTQGHFDNLKTYFQAIVDTIRASADNILWIPGLGYQSQYSGYAINPIEGENIGYAVHVYPGWFNSGNGYEPFQRGWDEQVQPVADFAPVMVTEMDWAPEKYESSWGKDITGTAGGEGFGANFKKITDECGNVSWLLFTSPDLLADFTGIAPADGEEYTFLNDPEACPWPIYQWFKDYKQEYDFQGASTDYLTLTDLIVENGEALSVMTSSSTSLTVNAVFADGHTENISSLAEYTIDKPEIVQAFRGRIHALKDGEANITISYTGPGGNKMQASVQVNASTFPLTNEVFNPDIWEDGTFDETTGTLITGQYGFGGWYYSNGVDLSNYKYLVVKLGNTNACGFSFRLYDENSYWTTPGIYDVGNDDQVVVSLDNMYKDGTTTQMDPSHIYYVGFWSTGGCPLIIDDVYLTNDENYAKPTGIFDLFPVDSEPEFVDVYTITGARIRSQVERSEATKGLKDGIYIVGRKKVVVVGRN
ncbi:cellulase family glycosylhydrolase [uncultured Draconibacterium sp.]|uniref:glycoside hydrolase family 5 protein n=1 Tax=uncultured Draconibacterium sp. TaxID=1573823 RepID=UPI002AA6BE83|nr:cellulase family glycosylhydrolase [uncultured Draconibacterium sp.]